MGRLYITEYSDVGDTSRGAVPVALEPPVAQQVVTFSTTTQSTAMNAVTRLIRLNSNVICSIEVGTDPTATTDSRRMLADVETWLAVAPGSAMKIAAIDNT